MTGGPSQGGGVDVVSEVGGAGEGGDLPNDRGVVSLSSVTGVEGDARVITAGGG